MAQRPQNNATCDIYHSPNAPPAAPSVAAARLHLAAEFARGVGGGDGEPNLRWTHVAAMDATADVRDNYPGAPTHTVYVPDQTGTGYEVVFVELVNRGRPDAYKRVYLDRKLPTWPTNEL